MNDESKKEKSLKSFWDWAELLSKFMPAIVVAIIAIMGNHFLQNKQKEDSNLKLYTQLLANKENSENTLRKDMFSEMLKSFLAPEQEKSEGGENSLQSTRKDLLRLDLMARNFHESLDMKPLFKYVLMEIIRPRIMIRRQYEKYHRLSALSMLIDYLLTEENQQKQFAVDDLNASIDMLVNHYGQEKLIGSKAAALTEALGSLRFALKKNKKIHDHEFRPLYQALSTTMKNEIASSLNPRDGKQAQMAMPKDEIEDLVEKMDEIADRRIFIDTDTKSGIIALSAMMKNEIAAGPKLQEMKRNQPAFPMDEIEELVEKMNEIGDPRSFDDAGSTSGIITINQKLMARAIDQRDSYHRKLSRYDRELDRLVAIARRITRKQRDVLEDVAGKLSLRIPLRGFDAGTICTEVRPPDISRVSMGFCPTSEEQALNEKGRFVKGKEKYMELSYLDSNGEEKKGSKRHFSLRVRYAYPRWKQVYVEAATNINDMRRDEWKMQYEVYINKFEGFVESKHNCDQRLLKQDDNQECLRSIVEELKGYLIQVNAESLAGLTSSEFEELLKDKLGLSVSSFWLEYFDFPLVDNAYINSEQRYSVVLDEFKASPDGEDESVKITLLYYPASYAGLKEKSFYNNKLMDYLMRQDFFKDTK